MGTQLDMLGNVIPDDDAYQVEPGFYIRHIGPQLPQGALVLDVGCGTGRSQAAFRKLKRHIRWIGVDISSSPAVDRRSGRRGSFVTFDGVSLPFGDGLFDCVYSNQVLEHVRHPERLLAEVARVIKPGACFIGGTSNLEPYHAFSYWNFTPFGFRTIVEDAGLQLIELRPGIDGPTLIERQVKGRPADLTRYFKETSPLNREIISRNDNRKRNARRLNNRMLQFCGQFGFHAVKPQ